MVNFMCQFDWATGSPDIQSNIILGVSVNVFLGKIDILFFFRDFIYLFERENERQRAREGSGSEGEADPLLSREPYAGLDPGTPGS